MARKYGLPTGKISIRRLNPEGPYIAFFSAPTLRKGGGVEPWPSYVDAAMLTDEQVAHLRLLGTLSFE